MPVTRDFVRLHPHGIDDLRAYRSALRAFAERAAIPLVIADSAFEARDAFKDPVHLDAGGRRRFSDAVAMLWPDLTGGIVRRVRDL